MSISRLKMDKMRDKMRQDAGKMRKMKDVSSVLAVCGALVRESTSNSAASRGPGEVPPLGWANPSPRQLPNPYSRAQRLIMSKPL